MNDTKYIKFTLVGEGSYIQKLSDLNSILDAELDHIRCGDIGDSVEIKIEIINMTDEEYSLLPEFIGW